MYEPLGVVFLGVEKGERRPSFSGNVKSPLDFVEKLGFTFLNGVDFDFDIYPAFDAIMDTYYVIGRDGRVSYISPVTGFEQGAINIPAIADEINRALEAVPTETMTWSRIKLLWQ